MITIAELHAAADATLVVPSRQRAEAARLALARSAQRRGARVWATPDILAFDTWLKREIDARARSYPLPRLLSSAQEWLLWRQSAAQFTDELELLARGALAEGLRCADELAGEYLISLTAAAAAEGAEGRLLCAVRAAVRERCVAERLASARELASELEFVGSARPLELAGYLSLPPLLQKIAAARRAQGLATRERAAPAAARQARILAAANPTEELERIAAWAHERLTAQPQARILIVLPGAAASRDRLATLVRQALDPAGAAAGELARGAALVAIEGGEPLARAPLVAHALATLCVLTRATDFEALSSWLGAPFWREPDASARAHLDLALRRAQHLQIDLLMLLQELASSRLTRGAHGGAAQQLSAQLIAAAASLQAPSAAPREWAVRLRGALEALHFPGPCSRTSEEEQTLARFNELLDEFGELGVATRSMTREQALRTFTELAMRVHFRPASGDALVTITAHLEDPVISYEGIWVAGLDALAWPAPLQINPFLSAAAQRAAGIPAASAAGRTAEARSLMLAWRAAAGELVLSYASRAEDLERAPSPLLAEWTAQAEGADQPSSPWLPLRLHREGVLQRFTDERGPTWASGEALPQGVRALELQSLCAFRAFAELRLGCAPLDAPAPGVTSRERGLLLHDALEGLWRELKDSHSLQQLPAADLAELIDKCVAAAAHARWQEQRPVRRRERRRTARLIEQLCQLERTRAHFSVRHVEHEVSVALGAAQLTLRIDRIDALADGGLAILDYKSGARKSMDWYGERLSHPQLLAYLAAVGGPVRALATVNVAAREVRFAGIASHANLLPKLDAAEARSDLAGADPWEASREFWQARIEALARDFLSGYAAVDPAPHACDYCEVASFCRIADQLLPADVEEELVDD